MNLKEYCDCGKLATWCYMPGYISGDSPYHCDDCVPRGCSCNEYSIRDGDYSSNGGINPTGNDGVEGVDWVWTNDDKTVWHHIDSQGRPYPCAEYDYDSDGYERIINPHEI